MSGGFGSDAITTVLPVGGQAQRLSDNMPGDDGALVINTATSGTVLLGTSYSINPNTSVPLPAGAAVQWTDDGELWAFLSDDATAAVTVVVTDRASSWQPSPEAVGVAVATQLLATGVPNVISEYVIADNDQVDGSTQYDISKAASVALLIAPRGGWTPTKSSSPTVAVLDSFGNYLWIETLFPSNLAYLINAGDAATLQIINNGTPPPFGVQVLSVTITGSNRPTSNRIDTRAYAAYGFQAALPSQALTAGVDYALGLAQHQGTLYARFAVSNGSVANLGFWFYFDDFQNRYVLADANECVAHSQGKAVYRMVALPVGLKQMYFHCVTAGTSAIALDLAPANL